MGECLHVLFIFILIFYFFCFGYLRILLELTFSSREIAGPFLVIVNKRLMPEYYEVIKEGVAFSTLRVSTILLLFKRNSMNTLPLIDNFCVTESLDSKNVQTYH